MIIIATNRNIKDFQSIVFELINISWDEFCEKVINEEEYIQHIGISSMEWGTTTKRLHHGAVTKVDIKDDFHLRVHYQNGDISEFYNIGKQNISIMEEERNE